VKKLSAGQSQKACFREVKSLKHLF